MSLRPSSRCCTATGCNSALGQQQKQQQTAAANATPDAAGDDLENRLRSVLSLGHKKQCEEASGCKSAPQPPQPPQLPQLPQLPRQPQPAVHMVRQRAHQRQPPETGRLYSSLSALAEDKAMLTRPNESNPGVGQLNPRSAADVVDGHDDCAICLDGLIGDSGYHPGSTDLEVLTDNDGGCGHVFHAYCFYSYINSLASYAPKKCPICRTDIPSAVVNRAMGAGPTEAQTQRAGELRRRRIRFTFALDVMQAYDATQQGLPPSGDAFQLLISDQQVAYGYSAEETRQALPRFAHTMNVDQLIVALRAFVRLPRDIPVLEWPPLAPVLPVVADDEDDDDDDAESPPPLPPQPPNVPAPPPGAGSGVIYDDATDPTSSGNSSHGRSAMRRCDSLPSTTGAELVTTGTLWHARPSTLIWTRGRSCSKQCTTECLKAACPSIRAAASYLSPSTT